MSIYINVCICILSDKLSSYAERKNNNKNNNNNGSTSIISIIKLLQIKEKSHAKERECNVIIYAHSTCIYAADWAKNTYQICTFTVRFNIVPTKFYFLRKKRGPNAEYLRRQHGHHHDSQRTSHSSFSS